MFEGPLQDLIDEFSRLPGIGPKSAQRIAFHVLHMEPEDIERLQNALGAVRDGVTFCRICCNISREDVCRICINSQRDASTICVVEEPKDIQVIERTGEVTDMEIDPKIVDPEDIDTLKDLLLGAFKDANQKLQTLAEEKMGPLSQGFDGLGGLGF